MMNAKGNRQMLCQEIQRLEADPERLSPSLERRGMMHLLGDNESGMKSLSAPAWYWTGNPIPWEDPVFAENYTTEGTIDFAARMKRFNHDAMMNTRTQIVVHQDSESTVMMLVTSLQGHRPTTSDIRSGQCHHQRGNQLKHVTVLLLPMCSFPLLPMCSSMLITLKSMDHILDRKLKNYLQVGTIRRSCVGGGN
jgi:hypothetical protein